MIRSLLILLLVFVPIAADTVWDLTKKGSSALARGDFDAAVTAYRGAVSVAASAPAVRYNLARALSLAGKFDSADSLFATTRFTDLPHETQRAFSRGVNREKQGDALVRSKQNEGAIKAYESALQSYAAALDLSRNGSAEALKNSQLTAKKLAALRKQDQQEKKKQEEDKKKNPPDPKQDPKKDDPKKDDSEKKDPKKEEPQKDPKEPPKDPKEPPKSNPQGQPPAKPPAPPKPAPSQPEKQEDATPQQKEDARALLGRYADDAKDLNRPQKPLRGSSSTGKDW